MSLILSYEKAVALRKESVDRNMNMDKVIQLNRIVALRKESVDRNAIIKALIFQGK